MYLVMGEFGKVARHIIAQQKQCKALSNHIGELITWEYPVVWKTQAWPFMAASAGNRTARIFTMEPVLTPVI